MSLKFVKTKVSSKNSKLTFSPSTNECRLKLSISLTEEEELELIDFTDSIWDNIHYAYTELGRGVTLRGRFRKQKEGGFSIQLKPEDKLATFSFSSLNDSIGVKLGTL